MTLLQQHLEEEQEKARQWIVTKLDRRSQAEKLMGGEPSSLGNLGQGSQGGIAYCR